MKKISEVDLMHSVWDNLLVENRNQTGLSPILFDEIVSSIFATGSFYFYIIDFFNMGVSKISTGFYEAHHVNPESVQGINDILQLVHPDDMNHVAACEKLAYEMIYQKLGVDKLTRYKVSYNFRFKTQNDTYKLFNHQALVLTVDENGNFIQSLNIHTNISHLTTENNYTFSLIGLEGEPSYLNIRAKIAAKDLGHLNSCRFTNREIQVIKLLSQGFKSREIMEELSISLDTVKSHRKNILAKSECKNATELMLSV